MRIFLALSRSPNPSFTSDIWKANLHDPLVAMGHDVVLWDEGGLALFDLDPAASSTAPARARYTEGFVRAVETAHCDRPLDLVLTYVSASHLEPAAIARVRERIAPIVNFFCNNVHQFHLVKPIAPAFDLSLVPEADAVAKYRRAGAEPFFWPMAANPALYHPVPAPVRYDATFAGQRYGDRTSAILALREAGIDAHAFGQHWAPDGGAAVPQGPGRKGSTPRPGIARAARLLLQGKNPFRAARDMRDWERLRAGHGVALHGPVSDDGYVSLFSESRVSLGFLVLGDSHRTFRPLRQVRLREFEAPMAGAFYLTGWLPEIALHYEVGKEIVCYRSRDELVDLARYYLAHDVERERIRLAGQVRALRDHTWERRYGSLFEELRRKGFLRRGAAAPAAG